MAGGFGERPVGKVTFSTCTLQLSFLIDQWKGVFKSSLLLAPKD